MSTLGFWRSTRTGGVSAPSVAHSPLPGGRRRADLPPSAFQYVECSIPEGLTLREFRRQRYAA